MRKYGVFLQIASLFFVLNVYSEVFEFDVEVKVGHFSASDNYHSEKSLHEANELYDLLKKKGETDFEDVDKLLSQSVNFSLIESEGISYSYPVKLYIGISNGEMFSYRLEFYRPKIDIQDPEFNTTDPTLEFTEKVTIVENFSNRIYLLESLDGKILEKEFVIDSIENRSESEINYDVSEGIALLYASGVRDIKGREGFEKIDDNFYRLSYDKKIWFSENGNQVIVRSITDDVDAYYFNEIEFADFMEYKIPKKIVEIDKVMKMSAIYDNVSVVPSDVYASLFDFNKISETFRLAEGNQDASN